ncbi:hypothetical protein P3T23_003964 [Paraburkholderia sp. GAS448]|jgi:hypothetical protein|uniref:hypothetical protein n=1 Tax=Paraburkholderia sp. GAS448 TaxID=3035136 RepID=UPI003D219F04
MKLGYTLGALAVAVFAQSAQATTEVKTLSLQPVLSCGVSGSAAALRVQGDVVVLEAK